jgi:WD40 repeat protein
LRKFQSKDSVALTKKADGAATWKTLTGHSDCVLSLAVTRNNTLISGSYDRSIKFYDLEVGVNHLTLNDAHNWSVNTLAFALDDNELLSGSSDCSIKLWNSATGELIHTFEDHTNGVNSIVVSKDTGQMFSACWDGEIKIWDLSTYECKTIKDTGGNNPVNCLVLLKGSSRLVSGSTNAEIKVFEMSAKNGQYRVRHTLIGHELSVRALVATKHGHVLCSGSADTRIKIWSLINFECIETIEAHDQPINALRLTVNGHLLSASDDGTIKLWQVDGGILLREMGTHESAVHALALDKSEKRLMSGDWSGHVKVWDVESGECVHTIKAHKCGVNALLVNRDGELISAGFDKSVKKWGLVAGECFRTIKQAHGSSVLALAINQSKNVLISASFDATLKMWDINSGVLIRTLLGHKFSVNAVVVTENGILCSGGDDFMIRMWDAETGRFDNYLTGHKKSITALAVTRDGFLASASRDLTIRIWSLSNLVCMRTLKAVDDDSFALALVVDSRNSLISAGTDGRVKVWEWAAGSGSSPRYMQTSHDKYVRALAVCYDTVVSASADKTIKIWNTESGRCVSTLSDGHDDCVLTVAVSESGKIVSGGWDKKIVIWDIDV